MTGTGSGRRFALIGGLATVAALLALVGYVHGVSAAGSTTLVINEIDYDQPSTDTAEFLELKNVSAAPIDLDAYSVELVNGTGGGATLYQTIDLPSGSLAPGDFYVVCASTTTVANCDLDVSPDTNLIQNGAPDAVGLRLGGTLVDAVSYEGDSAAPYREGSGTGLDDTGVGAESISRCPDGVDSDQNNVDFARVPITPGAANNCETLPPPPFGTCGDGATRIHVVQGSGLASPLAGQQRVIEGIVVGDFQGGGAFGGFYVQEEDADTDADPQTSEGIFVFSSTPVAIGDAVRVRGTVIEFSGLTELTTVTDASVCSSGNTLPVTTALNMPVSALTDFETTEGMRVSFSQSLVISEYFNYDRFGELVLALPLTGESRAFTPTSIDEPGAPALARAQANSLRRITLDDGLNTQNPSVLRHPNGADFSLANRFRGGDTVQNVTGVMDYRFDLYRVQPTVAADYTAANPRPDAPEDVGGDVRVAAMNTLNFFLTPDYPSGNPLDNKCGPLRTVECRGADFDQPLEFTRQRDKLLAALAGLGADVIGLNEIENTAGVDPLGDPTNGIVVGLNTAVGSGTYAAITTGTIGGDAIRVGLIYKPSVVTPVGDFEILDSGDDPRFRDTLNRPVLAQTFDVVETGARFTVAVNHLKSKGSDCNTFGDPDTGDGQGNCNVTRKLAAEALVDWLATDPTGSGDPDFLIIGDLNSYAMEDPIDAVKAGPDDSAGTTDDYTNLVARELGTYAYSYVFDGQAGYLDHALSSASLTSQVADVAEWHINADEPDVLDYDTSFKPASQDALYEPNAYRSSDHDPVLVGLDACDDVDPTLQVSVTPNLLWPPNHRYITVQATVIADDNYDPNPTVVLVGLTSNEPDNGPDDGNTTNDIVRVDDDTFRLRAERRESGTGRVYTITYRATDDCGNATTRSAVVSVPVSR
jgi:predicted extracellular nuclease